MKRYYFFIPSAGAFAGPIRTTTKRKAWRFVREMLQDRGKRPERGSFIWEAGK